MEIRHAADAPPVPNTHASKNSLMNMSFVNDDSAVINVSTFLQHYGHMLEMIIQCFEKTLRPRQSPMNKTPGI